RALYLAIRPMVRHNPTFKALHNYYISRPERPLKRQKSLIALCCKLLRVLFVIGQKQCEFDRSKLLQGLPQINESQAAESGLLLINFLQVYLEFIILITLLV